MKNLIFAAMMLFLCVNNSSAQSVIRNGNTFTVVNNKKSHKADTIVTQYILAGTDEQYPIIVNKNSGRCYVWRTSRKTGKKYKMYLTGNREDIARTICKELGIKYTESKKSKQQYESKTKKISILGFLKWNSSKDVG